METPQYVALIRGQTKERDLHATGIAIATDGLLVTCHHVIAKLESDAIVQVKFPNRKPIGYWVLTDHQIREHDIAFLDPQVPLDPPLTDIQVSLAYICPAKGAKLTGYGWANPDLFEAPQEHSFTVSGYMGEYGRIGLDGHANPGDSGGPLFDNEGLLTGIIHWKDNYREGHSAAIPAEALCRILDVPKRRRLLERCFPSLKASFRSISKEQSSLSASVTKQPSRGRLARDVIIISCSSHKSTGGRAHPRTHTIADTIANGKLAQEVFDCRCRILNLLKSGRVVGIELQEGNRAIRQQNRELILGPDFGGLVNEPRYLPAYLRYIGRCYQANPHEWSEFLVVMPEERPIILVVSGLYGLFDIKEFIQNYDCHLTDKVTNGKGTIADIWKRTATDILLSRLDKIEESGYHAGRVLDLLSEKSYQEIFDWGKVSKRTCVVHRKFERLSDREALDNMGIWLRSVVRDPRSLALLKHDEFFSVDGFLNEDRMMFESHNG